MLDQLRLDCLLDLGRACPELRQSIDVIPVHRYGLKRSHLSLPNRNDLC
ncbi:hypothetical protein AOX55_00005890 (plasmid) [Sinorhizobium fredii CCBAU 25509]|nr:hypothetical protein SF83666_b59070 [Sinorhizobium fredii CCBAU 83666]AWM28666.1 hypothetical protein AOX55_00005890 [Sinorhizobium fredii CCBAU 25509]